MVDMVTSDEYFAAKKLLEKPGQEGLEENLRNLSAEELRENLEKLGVKRVRGSIYLQEASDDQVYAVLDQITDENYDFIGIDDPRRRIREKKGWTKIKGNQEVSKARRELLENGVREHEENAREIRDDVDYAFALKEVYDMLREGASSKEVQGYVDENYSDEVYQELNDNFPLEDSIRSLSIMSKMLE